MSGIYQSRAILANDVAEAYFNLSLVRGDKKRAAVHSERLDRALTALCEKGFDINPRRRR